MKKTTHFDRSLRAPKTTIIVGNDGRIRELVSIILEDFGFASLQVSSAKFFKAGENLDEPELIVWDLNIGESLNAFLKFSEMRAQGLMKKSKTLLLAGAEVKADVRSSIDDSMTCLCSKPFTPTTFRSEIAKLIKEKSDA